MVTDKTPVKHNYLKNIHCQEVALLQAEKASNINGFITIK